ncbi:MAG: hypothetical protein NC908_02265 [Candidatus Omnitrophica bacterium]|nr:hypothetical protein [Candidatus Omnitrophota bacterium]
MINFYPWFRLDSLNAFIVLAIGLFSLLVIVYSARFRFIRRRIALQYYICIILTALASIITVLANNLILLLVCWGFLGLTLYLLINLGDVGSETAAKKTFIIVGGSDAFLLLGIAIIYHLTDSLQMDQIKIYLDARPLSLSVIAYLCIAVACFAKAGAMPFHSWIPDCAESAPVPVVAYLPASLDKLLGIYLLVRFSLDLFVMNEAMNTLLMVIGAFTIVAAVMMALIQHNIKRLLGYHAVSQVGYMVLGIGTGSPLGIAGGIFHMLNHAIYKSCLFLTVGNIEAKTGTVDLARLGGLAKSMPFTYISCLVASLSISGVPPFNGFFSKWMIYQELIQKINIRQWSVVSLACLVAAMFGSGLTLASFMKLMHATFLGQRANKSTSQQSKDVAWTMWLPCIILAVICIIFGIFASQIPLRYFILPAIGKIDFIGIWYPGLSTLLIIVGLLVGIIIFKFKDIKPIWRQDKSFTGAETQDYKLQRISGTDFYNTIKELGVLKTIYKKAEAGTFDIYEQGKTLIFTIGRIFQYLHNGVLPTYLVWGLLGMLGLFLVLLR